MTSGRVVSINVSAGGVPKLSVESAEVGAGGILGDAHHDTKHHGGPDRALCLFAVELIDALRQEGHPISPGSAGENLTLGGMNWSRMVPGARIRIGDVLIELTSYTSPCTTIRESFVDARFGRVSEIMNPGWSRVYGRVLVAGTIRRGDSAVFDIG